MKKWRNNKIMDPEDRIINCDHVLDETSEISDSAVDFAAIIRNEAFPFLPAKVLCRFKAVCWAFANQQSEAFHDISGFFLQPIQLGSLYEFLSLDPKAYGVPSPSPSYFFAGESQNSGLIQWTSMLSRNDGGDVWDYYICNPVTKQWKKLPPTNTRHANDNCCCAHTQTIY